MVRMAVSLNTQNGSPMPLSDCEAFQWYLVIACEKCAHKQPLFRDPSYGKAKIRQIYKHRCEKCQHTGHYDGDGIERYQHIV
jgi:ribosomal protein S27E